MIADIDHDLLAAVIGGVALIVVATLPILWRQIQGSRRDERTDLLALRERIDTLLHVLDESQERRHAEHQEIRDLLRIHAELVQSFLNHDRWKGEP